LRKAVLEESKLNFEEIFFVLQGRLQEPTLEVARRLGFQATSQFEKHDYRIVLGEGGKKEQMKWVPQSLNYCTHEMGGTSLAGFPCQKKPFERKQTSHIIVSSFHIPQSKFWQTKFRNLQEQTFEPSALVLHEVNLTSNQGTGYFP
jgi:hypothetical protein